MPQRRFPIILLSVATTCGTLAAKPPSARAMNLDAHACQTEARIITLPAAPLTKSLHTFSKLTACPIMVDPDLLHDERTPAISGRYTPDDALTRLLAPTDLDATRTLDGFALQPTTRIPATQAPLP